MAIAQLKCQTKDQLLAQYDAVALPDVPYTRPLQSSVNSNYTSSVRQLMKHEYRKCEKSCGLKRKLKRFVFHRVATLSC